MRPQISASPNCSQYLSHTLWAKPGAGKYLLSYAPLTSCYKHLSLAVVILAAVLAVAVIAIEFCLSLSSLVVITYMT